MEMRKIRRPVEVVEVTLDAAPGWNFMIVDRFDQPLIQVKEFVTAMCLKEQLNASTGKVILELEHAKVLKKLQDKIENKVSEPALIENNDPNIYPEEFGIDPEKAKFIQKKEIDAGKVPKGAYDKPIIKEDIN